MAPTSDRPLRGLRIAAFESRLAESMGGLISRLGGTPLLAPSLREAPISENPEIQRFAMHLFAREIDVVIFLTGVGARLLGDEITRIYGKARFLDALCQAKIVVRGPKPLSVLREWSLPATVSVPEPNTWHELLEALDRELPVSGQRVAVQEYGQTNPELIAGLKERGAQVTQVPVYRWALPADIGPLEAAIRQMVDGQIDAALFTSAQQVVHTFEVAHRLGVADRLREAMQHTVVVASIGPTTSETLRAHSVEPHVVPDHPKMGHLVVALADHFGEQTSTILPVAPPKAGPPATDESDAAKLHSSLFLKACRREPTSTTPIWLMRQAGRYMPEYRAIRSRVSFMDLCKTPDLAAEVTISAAERLGVDAAILFADILLILEPMGFGLEFARGEGPIIRNPVRQSGDVDRVEPLNDPRALSFVLEAIQRIRAAAPRDLPLIGFAGAPFTLACYAIEGGSSRHYDQAKRFLYSDPGAWNALMARLVDATVCYLNAQIAAGAQAIQLFDSWVGTLGPADYETFVQPHMRRLFSNLTPGVPTIHFGTDTSTLLELQRDAGGDVIGLDWRVELGPSWNRLGPKVAIQGNLDPATLFAPIPEIVRRAHEILTQAAGRPGHIFNLGHGILPQTPVDHVRALIDAVHEYPNPGKER
jgi:uroporphyrinogen decarboxylase